MRLKELRIEKNLTQDQVATAIKTSRTNIGRWEKGENEPGATYIIELANFFQCSADFLLSRSDDLGNVTIKKDSSNGLSPEEESLISNFRTLPREERIQTAEYVQFLANKRGTKNKNA